MEEIKAAYRYLAKQCHPDFLGDEGHELCVLLNEVRCWAWVSAREHLPLHFLYGSSLFTGLNEPHLSANVHAVTWFDSSSFPVQIVPLPSVNLWMACRLIQCSATRSRGSTTTCGCRSSWWMTLMTSRVTHGLPHDFRDVLTSLPEPDCEQLSVQLALALDQIAGEPLSKWLVDHPMGKAKDPTESRAVFVVRHSFAGSRACDFSISHFP